jgi:hypothetical protein
MARSARATEQVALDPEPAVALWRDLQRWPSFVEGFARVLEQSGGWPSEGAKVVWESGTGGRGKVSEKVTENAAHAFATRVVEERLFGTQIFRAAPAEGGSRVEVVLEYELTSESPLRGVTDVLFIRRALRDSLTRTLRRYAVEAEEDAGLRERGVAGPLR